MSDRLGIESSRVVVGQMIIFSTTVILVLGIIPILIGNAIAIIPA